jgi:hypothetical protein
LGRGVFGGYKAGWKTLQKLLGRTLQIVYKFKYPTSHRDFPYVQSGFFLKNAFFP